MTRQNKSIAPKGKSVEFFTPPDLARDIVHHFMPSGRMCEPCRGQDGFYNELVQLSGQKFVAWGEITRGVDFLAEDWLSTNEDWLSTNTPHDRFDWIMTNPPWGKLFSPFLAKSLQLADNVVFLAPLNVWSTKSRIRMITEYGFGMVELMRVPTPKKPWPQSGFALGAAWLRRGWTGAATMSEL